jgi:hypothetical protein
MGLTLFVLLTDKRLYYALLEATAFVFVLCATLMASRVGQRKWLTWLIPFSIGFGLDPLTRSIRLAVEFSTSGLTVPRWVSSLEYIYWASKVVLIYGAFRLYQMVKAQLPPKSPAERLSSEEISWPPSVHPME